MDFKINTRIEMFAICTSLEKDIKEYIKAFDDFILREDLVSKAHSRTKQINDSKEELLETLDLGDFISIIINNKIDFGLRQNQIKKLNEFFDKIVPVRNRIMHSRPIEIGDRALLLEVLTNISIEINWIDWKELENTKIVLEKDRGQLLTLSFTGVKEYNPRVLHNLPDPEFDDTGYIGRKDDIKKITSLIKNSKNQIITVVGNGGIGKTALIVKTLYNLLDDLTFSFESVLWITLKTRTLSRGEFIDVKDAINSINEVYSETKKYIVFDEELDDQHKLIQFMDTFKTLLVIDNLETLNSEDVSDFFKEIPEKSKVLITSRVGIGELEYRYRLEGLNKQDALVYFRELSSYYGLSMHERSDDLLNQLITEKLFSNPLSIKWFLSGIYLGTSEETMLSQKDDLINFCISNVYNKLSDTSKEIMQIMMLESNKINYAVLDYYSNLDEIVLKQSINQLLSTNMIQLQSGNFVINHMSREYVAINYPPSNELIREIRYKRSKLHSILQEINVKREVNPYNPKSINYDSSKINEQIACHYLISALEFSSNREWEKSIIYCEKAQNIAPDFFEVYKILAFINAEKANYFAAMSNYELSIAKANGESKAIVYYLYSVFNTIKMKDYHNALLLIEFAQEIVPINYEIFLEKARIYMLLGKYGEAEHFWNEAQNLFAAKDLKSKNILFSRYAEIQRRKAENFQDRDYIHKYELYKKGIETINQIEDVDFKAGIIMLNILNDLSRQYYHDDSISLMYKTFEKHRNLLLKLRHRNKAYIYKNLTLRRDSISGISNKELDFIIETVQDFKSLALSVTEVNKGIITKLNGYYGFIANKINPKGIYFLTKDALSSLNEGDEVAFDIIETDKGQIYLRNIISVEEFYDE